MRRDPDDQPPSKTPCNDTPRHLAHGGRGRTFESCRAHGSTKPFLRARNAEQCAIRPSYSASDSIGEADRALRGAAAHRARAARARSQTGTGGDVARKRQPLTTLTIAVIPTATMTVRSVDGLSRCP